MKASRESTKKCLPTVQTHHQHALERYYTNRLPTQERTFCHVMLQFLDDPSKTPHPAGHAGTIASEGTGKAKAANRHLCRGGDRAGSGDCDKSLWFGLKVHMGQHEALGFHEWKFDHQ